MIHVKWRFGTQIQYPAHLFDPDKAVESINGDGTTFGPNADGAKLLARGSQNVLDQTPHQNICGDGCRGETYSVRERLVGVSSGVTDGTIHCSRCRLWADGGMFRCFRLEYPAARRAIYDPVTARIGDSLRQ
jgi:hypothetical protein